MEKNNNNINWTDYTVKAYNVRQKRQGKMGDQAGKVSDASRATRLECKVPNCRDKRAVAALACEKPSCPSARKVQGREAAARRQQEFARERQAKNKKGITHSGAGWCKTWAMARPTD
jgi:hypothetical protein